MNYKTIQLLLAPFSNDSAASNNKSQSTSKNSRPWVATLTLNRPQRGNAITAGMAQEILHALDTVHRHQPPIRLLILTGTGRYFCTGMDMQAATQATDDFPTAQDPVSMFQNLFEQLHLSPIPTLCLLNGPALGGGVGLVFACDLRLSTSPQHYLALTECKRGLLPALISLYIVPVLPPALSMEMMVTGARMPLEVFVRVGAWNAVMAEGQRWQDWVEKVLDSAPGAVKMAKQVVQKLSGLGGEERERMKAWLRTVFEQMMASEEASYGMMCFLQKKQPDWSSLSKL